MGNTKQMLRTKAIDIVHVQSSTEAQTSLTECVFDRGANFKSKTV